MRIGASIFFTADSVQPAELGVELEAHGFESLWLPEHSHMPLAQQQELGDRRLPEKYEIVYDAFASLAAVASTTSRLLLGTGITLLGIRDPIWTAKATATLDRLSGGRFLLGIGYGWLRREYESHGIPFDQRREITREKLRLVKALWTSQTTAFAGDHIRLLPSRQGPKPLQEPHPPVHIGAALGPGTKADLASLADGWIPLGMYRVTAAEIAEVRAAATARDRGPLEISVYLDYTQAYRIDEMAEVGCDRVVVVLPSAPRTEVLEYVEQIADGWIDP